jgi:hypothetical protein
VAAGKVRTFELGEVQSGGIIFPGNCSTPPVTSKASIIISVNSDGSDPDGSIFPSIDIFSRGLYIAYEDANAHLTLLPNFHLNVSQVGFGMTQFNKTWAYERARLALPGIGVAYHGTPFTQCVIGLNDVFKQLGIEVPNVTPAGDSSLSDPQAFPLFLRVACSNRLFAIQIASLFQLFDWHQAAFIYSDSEDDRNAYECFLNISAQFRINLTNSEHNRCLPVNLASDVSKVNATLKEIMASPFRIIIISHIYNYKIPEIMYDLGAREGEYLFVMEYGLTPRLYSGSDEAAVKRRTVAKGALMPMPTFFVGSTGRYVQRRLMEKDGENYYASGCMYYDNAMLVAHTLGYMLAKGLHYEQGLKLAKEMRETKFQGCLGRVQIEKGTNDNIPGEFSYYNLQDSNDSETLQLVNIATFSPYKTQRFTLIARVQWPDGKERFQDIWPLEPNCNRYIRDITFLSAGESLGIGICMGFTVYAAISAIAAGIRWRRVHHEMLTGTSIMTLEDMVCLASPLIEAVQMAAIGGSLDVPIPLQRVLFLVTFRFDMLDADPKGVYWRVLNLAISLASVQVIAVLIVACNWQGRKCCMQGWAEFFLFSAGNWLFIPLLTVLLNVYMCSRGVDSELSAAFLDLDCAVDCWTGFHTNYIVANSVLLVAYIPAAVLGRLVVLGPEWHVKEQPRHILVKSIIEMGLVALSVLLKSNQTTIHAALHMCLVTFYAFLHVVMKAYNYDRY